MSEAVTKGTAAAGVAACVVLVGLAAAAAARSVQRSLARLSEQGRREVARLEKTLAVPPTHATTKEARQAFEEAFKRIRTEAIQLPSLQDHAETVARMLALQGSPLGACVADAQWTQIGQASLPEASFEAILNQAANDFTQANAAAVAQSIRMAAQRTGLNREERMQSANRQGTISLVLKDADGRALIATVAPAEDGAQLTLDLTGFGDGSCHKVMDRLLAGLAEEGIRLDGVRRRSHYRREGLTPVVLTSPPPRLTARQSVEPRRATEAERFADRLRRQQQSRIVTLKPR